MKPHPNSVLAAVLCGLVSLSLHAADANVLFDQFKELGAPEPEKRKAAREQVVQAKLDAPPVLLAMLSPKQNTDEPTRLGVVRALAECQPLSEQAAQTLGWTAVYDKYPEVRREACAAIRQLQDDRAVGEVLRHGLSQDPNVRRAAALALREIDDPRALAMLVRSIPNPSVTANITGPNGPLKP
ncbi:MAG: HEAT repeat domain-containing protein, partial [Planctomycetota bacterium]